mgnify:CR=1 FL=1
MSRLIRPALAACLVLAPVATAQAQDWRGTPVYGEVRLENGFTPDPHTVNIQAGGNRDASSVKAAGCIGQIGNNPDYVVRYRAGSLPLYIRAESSSDTSLVVRAPNGNWSCDDDSAGNLNPQVAFNSPDSGTYHIWVGSLNGSVVPATLQVSELTASIDTGSGSSDQPDLSAEATYEEIILRSGFTPDPRTIEMVAGGPIRASNLSSQCTGYIARVPDVELTYRDNGNYPLVFTFASRADTVLVINAPDGNWYCDDDSNGNLDPRVTFNSPQAGIYDIFVGTLDGEMANGTLSITEID